ncbi:MAG: PepSY-like domain-containing protein, partial [Bacteroidia bacterium]|nr:PepSY-like domain-containing protein [Bacteroidia bacterium]
MKNKFIVLIAVIAISLSSNCQSIAVPTVVKNAFETKYPDATNVKWGKESVKEYEAEFILNNNPVSANFDLDGSWVETESVIPVLALPVAVSVAISNKYSGAQITMAEKTEQPGNKILYEVTIEVNGKRKSIEI